MKVYNCSTSVRKLASGQCFWYSESLFIKTDTAADGQCTVVKLSNGKLSALIGDTTVVAQTASVVCEA